MPGKSSLRIEAGRAAGRSPPGKRPSFPAEPALFRLGFRPFYLLAGIFAALSVALWAAQYAGWLESAYLPGPVWHAHEMLFGYTMAVITGFLFTAVRNWTAQPTPTGPWLAAVAGLWIAGRVLVLTPFGWASAAVNAAFPVAVAAGIGIPLIRSGNRRNYFFIVLLIAMAIAVAMVHLEELGAVALPPWVSLQVALDVVLFIMTVMGGRVIPMFSNNGVPGCGARRVPLLERLVLASTIVLLVLDALRLPVWVQAAVLALCGAAHALRFILWNPWRTLAVPLVWVLHAAYAWIPIHLALRVLSALDVVPLPLATHALTVGAIGGLTIGMMTRTARGHTGRALVAGPGEVASYALVSAAAIVRVFAPLALPQQYVASVLVAALLWSGGYAVFVLKYWPILARPRVDGRPG